MRDRAGQALVEFVFVAAMLLLFVFGLIDFCRAISTRLVLTNLSREGSNLASRSTPITNAVDAVIAAANPLDINAHGRVIITAVAYDAHGNLIITNQLAKGGVATFDSDTKVGLVVGTHVKSGWIPPTTPSLPVGNQFVYVTEVFYDFQAATPIGKFLNFTLPSPLYDVAYF
ncbi:MAG TPA: TadE/TadG family type IV pilus assembly protein [Verrucomicrobiae bacterium]|nr:TadE/TadG family type IV pilus assembly protein [Verrucomicrobiae bacterium]